MTSRRVPLLWEAAIVGTAAFGLAVIVTWPLILSPADSANNADDALYQAWTPDWVQHALGSRATIWDANIFAPNPRTLAYSDSLVGAAVVLLPLRWLGASPLAVLSAGTLLGYSSSAVAGYIFGRVISGPLVGALTGVAFAYGTYGSFLGQHLNVLLHPAPALAATLVWVLAERSVAGRRNGLLLPLLAVIVALQATVSFNVLAITLVATGAMAIARVRDLGRNGVLGIGAAWLCGALLALPIAWPYLENARSFGGEFRWELAQMRPSGADFLHVDPRLDLWGDVLPSRYGLFGQPTFPGVALLILSIVGVLAGRKRSPSVVRTAAVLVLVGVLLGLGTSDQGWRQYAPYRLVYEWVPGATAIRATGRFWLVGLLGVGLLAGLGAEFLARWVTARVPAIRGRPTRRLALGGIGLLAVGAIVAEGYGSWNDLPKVEVAAVHRELARLPGDQGVLYLPVPLGGPPDLAVFNQARVVYGTTLHHRPTPNGYSGFYPPSWRELGRRVEHLPDEASLEFLRRIDVGFVVVAAHAGAWDPLHDPNRARPLQLVTTLDGDLLYRVPAS